MAATHEPVGNRIQELRKARGWTQENLAERSGLHPTYIGGIERGERNATIASFCKIADALGISLAGLVKVEPHDLERQFNAPADDIMSAVLSGFRAQVDVKGKFAELYLSRYLTFLKNKQVIQDFEWHDKDTLPDFVVVYKGRNYVVECKNLRSGKEGIYKRENSHKVEVQKTRNSKDGTNTRSYKVSLFQILAVCMFNQTRAWEFVFKATMHLKRAEGNDELLAIFQPVPFRPTSPWERDITIVLEEVAKDLC
jgi:transcriptional regulator with XRE-family HTH domain